MAKLIVNADDLGLTGGVNRAVTELHAAGVLTSATLMANAAASQEAVQLALAQPTLGIGCHLVLVDGEPVLSAQAIPHLANVATGQFRPTLGAFLPWLLGLVPGSGSAAEREREIEAEAAAQIAHLQAQGVPLTHIDTHKHVHIFPSVLRPVLRAAARAGIQRVRNPFEPAWSVRATPGAPWLRRTEVRILRQFEERFRRIVAEEGFTTTDGTLGVLATGTLNRQTVNALLQAIPENGVFELVAHPGYNDAELQRTRTRLRASRALEREALMAITEHAKIPLVSYRDLG